MGFFDFVPDIIGDVGSILFPTSIGATLGLDTLLGGGSDPKTTIKSVEKLTPEQQRILELLEGLIGDRAGEEITPLSGETLSLAALEQLAMNIVGGDTAGQFGESAIRDIVGRDAQDFEDFFQTSVQEPALRSFEQDILPKISGEFATRFFGGERREAQGRATEDLLRFLTQARSGLAFETEQAQRNQSLQALGLLPATASLDIAQLLGVLGGATSVRESTAAESARRIQEALGFIGLPTEEVVATTTPGQESPLAGLLSTAGTFGLAKGFGVF